MHHKNEFIQDFCDGICEHEDLSGTHKSADRTNLNEVALEEYTLPGQQISRICRGHFFNQTEQEEEEVEILEQSVQMNDMSSESAANFGTSPFSCLLFLHHKFILHNLTKFTLVLN